MSEAMVRTVLFLVFAGIALLLARAALRHWWEQRAGWVYELPVERRGAVVRWAASGVAMLVGAVVLVPVFGSEPPSGAVANTLPATTAPAPPQPAPPADPVKQGPPRTVARPAGGTLQEWADGTHVWLPPGYARGADVAFPVVVAHAPPDDPDLFAAFVEQAGKGKADTFIIVIPRNCEADPEPVIGKYRTLSGRTARAVLGVGDEAECALRQGLTHPDRYETAVGVSGVYGDLPTGPRPALLLASASHEAASRRSAIELRTAMRPREKEIRLLDGIPSRRALLGKVSGYLTEKLTGPAKRP